MALFFIFLIQQFCPSKQIAVALHLCPLLLLWFRWYRFFAHFPCHSCPSVLPPHLAPLQMWFHSPSGSFPGSPPEPLQIYLTNVTCSDMLPMKTLVNIQCIMIKMIMIYPFYQNGL